MPYLALSSEQSCLGSEYQYCSISSFNSSLLEFSPLPQRPVLESVLGALVEDGDDLGQVSQFYSSIIFYCFFVKESLSFFRLHKLDKYAPVRTNQNMTDSRGARGSWATA